jgi:hypothetical protein
MSLCQDLIKAANSLKFADWTTVSQAEKARRSSHVSTFKFDAHEKALKELLAFLNKPRLVKDVKDKFEITNTCANKRLDVLRRERGLIARSQKAPYLYWVI